MSSNRSRKDVELRVRTTTQMRWELGPFIADAAQSRLTHQGQPVSLTPKAFDLLVHLLRHRSQLVTRSELLDAVWPDGFVSDGSLTDTVWMARRALGHLGHWIETIPKRGYRFVGEAREIIGGGESERHSLEVRQATSNIEAFQLCLQGRHFCHEWPSSAFHRGRECFERAIRLDPQYSDAHFGLALYHGIGAAMGLLPPVQAWRQFQLSLATAKQLDPSLGENHNGTAAEYLYLHRDWKQAELHFLKALQIDPNDAETRNHYGFSLGLFGRFEEAVSQIRLALDLDPISTRFGWNLAFVLHQRGHHDQAIEECQRVLGRNGSYLHAHALIGDAHEQKGQLDAALYHWRQAISNEQDIDVSSVDAFWRDRLSALLNRITGGQFVPAMDIARVYARLGDRHNSFEWLRQALHEPSRLVLELPLDRRFDRLRDQPEFASIVSVLPNAHAARALASRTTG